MHNAANSPRACFFSVSLPLRRRGRRPLQCCFFLALGNCTFFTAPFVSQNAGFCYRCRARANRVIQFRILLPFCLSGLYRCAKRSLVFFWAGQYALRLLCGFHPDIKMHARLDFTEGRVLIWAFGAAAIILSLFLAPEPRQLERWSTVYIPCANLAFVFGYLPLLYIVGKKTQKK